MVELMENGPLEGAELPHHSGDLVIDQVELQHVFSVTPFAGQTEALSRQLSARIDVPLPRIGRTVRANGGEVFWTGQNQWFVSCDPVLLEGLRDVALRDQSDGWAVLSIRGSGSASVLARLCPLDLRDFGVGQVARSEFAHMMSIILPREDGYDIWVMRSFARTAAEHLKEAAELWAAVKALPS